MSKLWNLVNDMNIAKSKKNTLYILLAMVMGALIGTVIWLLAGRLFLPTADWFLCFAAYPALFVGFFGGMIYIFNHEFA